jgi:hypothetical protein
MTAARSGLGLLSAGQEFFSGMQILHNNCYAYFLSGGKLWAAGGFSNTASPSVMLATYETFTVTDTKVSSIRKSTLSNSMLESVGGKWEKAGNLSSGRGYFAFASDGSTAYVMGGGELINGAFCCRNLKTVDYFVIA